MIATWMLYTTFVGVLATVAALVLERAGRALRIQVRVVWVAAIATTLLWPVVINGRVAHPAPVADGPSAAIAAGAALFLSPVTQTAAAPGWRDHVSAFPTLDNRFDGWLLVLWGMASVVILAQLARSIHAIRRSRQVWKPRIIDGASVLLSHDLGPAVIGVRDLRIVLPQWTLALEPHLRAVILRHEDEHRRARDPLLLLGAILATAVAPWNVAIWWQCKRLRLAIETDCDARVLEREHDVERYGSLLVTIAERRGPQAPAIAAALTESISNLERRITIMTTPTPRFPRTTAAILAGVAAAALSIALVAPTPAGFAASRSLLPTNSQSLDASPHQPMAPADPAPVAAPRAPHADVVDARTFRDPRVAPPQAIYLDRSNAVVDAPASQSQPATDESRSLEVLPAAPLTRRANIIIRGQVTGPGDVPLENVSVTATTPSDGSRTAKSDSRGWYTLLVPESDGIYLISFVATGFEAKNMQVKRVGAEAVLVANAQLDPVTSDTSHTVARAPVDAGAKTPGIVAGSAGVRRFSSTTVDTTVASNPPDVYFEFQVTKPVGTGPGNKPPSYPAELRLANVEGEVDAQFVVNADGRADMATFKALKSTHPLFTESVKQALPALQFNPAMIGDRAVKQLVHMPFVFTLSK